MAYNPAIPQPTDKLRVSQGDLLDNFIDIDTFVDVNHYGFASADIGKHLYIQMPIAVVPPNTTVTEVALYADNGMFSTTPELWFRRHDDGAAINFTECVLATNGWSREPCGALKKWGTDSVDQNSSATINFPTGSTFPVFSVVYNAQATLNGVSGMTNGFYISSFTTTSITVFNANTTGGTRSFYYHIIGK